MFSPSVVSTADTTAAPLPSSPAHATPNAPGGLDGAASFQNILAQAVAPGAATQSSPALSAPAPSVVAPQPGLGAFAKANFVLTWQPAVAAAPAAPADAALRSVSSLAARAGEGATLLPDAGLAPPAASDPLEQAAAGPGAKAAAGLTARQTAGAAPLLKPLSTDESGSAAPPPDDGDQAHLAGTRWAAGVAASTPNGNAGLAKLSQPAPGRAASLKGTPHGSARVIQATSHETAADGISNDSLVSNQTAVADATAQTASAPGQNARPASPSEQNNQAFARPVAALGGGMPLNGAAFLLHIKPEASQGAARPANTYPTNAMAGAADSDAASAPGQAAAAPIGKTDASAIAAPTSSGGGLGAAAEAAQWISAEANAPAGAAARAESASAPPSAPLNALADDSSSIGAQPVRSVQVQLAGSDDQRVDLRLIEHAGGLSVSVRASDGALTSSLQEHLPELSARLASEHYETQVLLPFASQTSHGGSAGSSGQQPGQSSGQSADQGGGRSFSQGGSSAGGDGNPRQGRQPDRRQEWQNPLAASAPSSAAISFANELSISDPAHNSTTNQ